MQKKKLDLNQLLAKYEGISNNTSDSPLRERNHQRIEEEFYQHPAHSRTMQQPPLLPEKHFHATQPPSRPPHGNFAMSKSEVENYLLSLKDDIRVESREVARSAESALKLINDNFHKNLQKIRRDLLDLLNLSFQQAEKSISQELLALSKHDSPEMTAATRKIHAFDQDIDRLMAGLKGTDYRKVIAEVVTRDFSLEIAQIKNISSAARSNYVQSLGEVEVDRARIQAIRQQVQRLFFVNRKVSVSAPVAQREESSGLFGLFKEKTEPPIAGSRTRKSFFNFGSD